MKKFLPVIIIVIVVALGASLFALNNSGSDTEDPHDETSQNTDAANTDNSGSGNAEEQDEATNSQEIEIKDFAYAPTTLTVKKGTTVTWANKDDAEHNVVFDDSSAGQVEGGRLIGKDESVSFTFNEVGEFPYHCSPHPYMKATVKVTE